MRPVEISQAAKWLPCKLRTSGQALESTQRSRTWEHLWDRFCIFEIGSYSVASRGLALLCRTALNAQRSACLCLCLWSAGIKVVQEHAWLITFLGKVLLYIPRCPNTHRDPSVSAYQLLGLNANAFTSRHYIHLFSKPTCSVIYPCCTYKEFTPLLCEVCHCTNTDALLFYYYTFFKCLGHFLDNYKWWTLIKLLYGHMLLFLLYMDQGME